MNHRLGLKFRSDAIGTQVDLQRTLSVIVDRLVADHAVETGRIEAVFPGQTDPDLSRMFVIEVSGDTISAIEALKLRSDIELVYEVPSKRSVRPFTSRGEIRRRR